MFYGNGLFLKQGLDFQHNFNKAKIESVQNKHSSLTRELNIIKERMQDYQRNFNGLEGKYISAGRRKKENERKTKMRKKKQLVKNLSRICNVCVAYPFGNGLSQCLVYTPSVRVPEICINTEDISLDSFT